MNTAELEADEEDGAEEEEEEDWKMKGAVVDAAADDVDTVNGLAFVVLLALGGAGKVNASNEDPLVPAEEVKGDGKDDVVDAVADAVGKTKGLLVVSVAEVGTEGAFDGGIAGKTKGLTGTSAAVAVMEVAVDGNVAKAGNTGVVSVAVNAAGGGEVNVKGVAEGALQVDVSDDVSTVNATELEVTAGGSVEDTAGGGEKEAPVAQGAIVTVL